MPKEYSFRNPRPSRIPPVSGMPRLVSFSPMERLDAARLGSRRLGDLLRRRLPIARARQGGVGALATASFNTMTATNFYCFMTIAQKQPLRLLQNARGNEFHCESVSFPRDCHTSRSYAGKIRADGKRILA